MAARTDPAHVSPFTPALFSHALSPAVLPRRPTPLVQATGAIGQVLKIFKARSYRDEAA